MSELLKELGHQVTVANPRRLKLISQSDCKQDRTDAELLARLGPVDTQLWAPIQHRGTQAQAGLAVTQARDALVRCPARLVNQARGMVKSFGERLPKCDAESFYIKAPASPSRSAHAAGGRGCIDGAGLCADAAGQGTLQKKSHGRRIYRTATEKRAVGRQRGKQLHISKAGDPFWPRLLLGSANYILGPLGTDSDLRRGGLELSKRGGQNAKKRAKVAVARKLAVLVHRLWVTGEEYKPIGYGKKSQATAA
jgi:transposase